MKNNSVNIYNRRKEEMIKNHDSIIGYMGIITDYLLFEKNGDFHLKLYITTRDYEGYMTEVKYMNYIMSWGYPQFFRFCMDFCLLCKDEDNNFSFVLDKLLGAYCAVNYYNAEFDGTGNADRIKNVMPVFSYGEYYDADGNPCFGEVDMWSGVDFNAAFMDTEVNAQHFDEIDLDDSQKDIIINDYFSFVMKYGSYGYRSDYIYIKDSECASPCNPRAEYDMFEHFPYYRDINAYMIVTENDPESDIDISSEEPPLRPYEKCMREVYSNITPIFDDGILLM